MGKLADAAAPGAGQGAPDLVDLVACPVWQEDWSVLLAELARLRAEGVADLSAWLAASPGRLADLARLVRPLRANAAARAQGVPRPSLASALPSQLVALWAGACRHAVVIIRPESDGPGTAVRITLVLAGDGSGMACVTEENPDMPSETRQRMAEAQRLEALGRLTGAMAHDFNNLLAVVMGYAEILADGLPSDGAQHRMAMAILAAAERGAELTGQMLAFARRQPLNPQPCDPEAVLRGIEGLLRRLLPVSVRLELLCDPGAGPIEVDVAALETALVQIVLNARDAMPDGGLIRITLDTELPDADADRSGAVSGPLVRIAVRDEGTGMDAQTRARVFEPFVTTKPRSPGTGMGLSMVHGFVRQSGGDVRIFSAPGEGTEVALLFPLGLGLAEDGGEDVGPESGSR